MQVAKKNIHSTIERPQGIDKYINTTYELCGHKRSEWVKDGTGDGTGRAPVHMHTCNTMFLQVVSRLYLGAGEGYMPTQWVIDASTHYVNDYWEDKDGKPVFEHLTPDAAKAKGYTFRPGLMAIYGEAGLKKQYARSVDKGICFKNGILELGKYGDDPVLRAFVNEHEQNKNAPRAKENKDQTRSKLFMFQPLIRENKAAKTPAFETFDAKLEAITFVGSLRTKNPGGGYSYNESMMDAVLAIMEEGIGLRKGDVNQKFDIIIKAANTLPKQFMDMVNSTMDEYKMEIGKGQSLDVLSYTATEVKLTANGKKDSIYAFSEGADKETIVKELVLHFLSGDRGKNDYRELLRSNELAKLSALKKGE